jgi:hypothetical protein
MGTACHCMCVHMCAECVPCVPGGVRGCPNVPCLQCVHRSCAGDWNARGRCNNRTSQPIVIASVKVAAPVGRIMNSCIASLLPACDPPLITLKDGTGRTRSSLPARSA